MPSNASARVEGFLIVERASKAWPIARRLMGEPGILPLGILARDTCARFDHLVSVERSVEPGRNFSNADGAHDGQGGIELAGQQCRDFLIRSVVDHCFESSSATGVKPFARRQKDQRMKIDVAGNSADVFLLPFAQGPPGRPNNLQCARNPLAIGGF